MKWRVYLLRCRDKTYYCGITTDITRRIDEHLKGVASKYTSGRRPVTVVVVSGYMTRSEALKLEAAVKKLPRADKPRAIWHGGDSRGQGVRKLV